MKVLLRQPVPQLGRSGDLVEVAEAYARNFLLPKGLAVPATATLLAQAEHRAAKGRAQVEKSQEKISQAQAKSAGLTLTIKAKANDQGKLFAAMKADQVTTALAKQLAIDFPAPHLEPDHWKTTGEHEVMLHWPGGKTSMIKLIITNG